MTDTHRRRANLLVLVSLILGAGFGAFAHGWIGAVVGAALGAVLAHLTAILLEPDGDEEPRAVTQRRSRGRASRNS